MSSLVQELKRRNVLRVGAAYLIGSWLILQIIDVVFPMIGVSESIGRPILIALALGFPAVLVFSWTFELTPQGLKKEKHVDRSQSVTHQTGRKLDRIIIVILISAVGLLLVDKFILQQPPADEPQLASRNLDSVAVLPFVNMSGAAENEYFSDGLTETLLHMLAQVPDLKVAARTSAFAFKGKDEDIRQIAISLDVATVLEGSVQRSGDQLRITAQLIEADSGFHLWSQTFDRTFDDVFTVQDEIATSVANALQATLLGTPTVDEPIMLAGVGTSNPAAYEKFLRALEQKNIGSYSSLPQAEGLFKEALVLDPQFTEAKVELVDSYEAQADTGLISQDEYRQRSRPLLEQVLTDNPRHGRALGYLTYIDLQESVRQFGYVQETTDAAREKLRVAISLSPSEPALYTIMAEISSGLRENEQALEWLDKGLVVDPLSANLHWAKGSDLLYRMDDPVAAEASFARARELAPEWTAVYGASAEAARFRGEFAESLRWDFRSMELDPRDHEIPASIGRIYYQLGLLDESDEMLRRAQALAPQASWTRTLEAERQLNAGNYERAILIAENMIRDNIGDRGNAWSNALYAYVVSKIELGRVADVPVFLESVIPGVTTSDFEARDFRDRTVRFFVAVALVELGSYDEANAIFDPLFAWFESNVPSFDENYGAYANAALIRGDNDAAIEFALKELNKPLGRILGWRMSYELTPWMKPILGDERIAGRLAELDAETQAAADDVRKMLASLDGA